MTKVEVIPNLPVSCLAEYITRGSRSPESVLRPYKFREMGEGQARIVFRPPVLTVIRRFFKSGRRVEVLQEAITEWEKRAEATNKKAVRSRHRSNIAGLQSFWHRFGDREFDLMPIKKISCRIEQIVFNATPDLWARFRGGEMLIKLAFGRRRRSYAEVVVLIMRRAALLQGHKIRKRNAIYLNVLSGEQVTASFTFKQAALTLSNAAREIAKVWPTVAKSAAPASAFKKPTEMPTITARSLE